jgi:hypothetical protein
MIHVPREVRIWRSDREDGDDCHAIWSEAMRDIDIKTKYDRESCINRACDSLSMCRGELSLVQQLAFAILEGDETVALALADKLIEERKSNY